MADDRYEPMTTRDHLRLLWRRRWLLLGVLAGCVGIAVGYIVLATPVYEARAELVVISDQTPRSAVLSAAAPLLSMLGEPVSALGGADLATQIQIIGSRPSLEAAYGLMHERPELLRRLEREGMTDELFGSLADVVESLPAQPPPASWAERYQELLESLMVAIIEDSDMIEVRCESADRALGRDFVNALVLAYLGRSLADAQATTRRTRRYVQEQLVDVEIRLAEAEHSLRQFGERIGTVALDESARQQIGLLVRLTEQAAMAESTMNARRAMQAELGSRLDEVEERIEAAITVTRNPEIAELQQALAEAEAERVGLLEEYAPGSMPVRRAGAVVEELRGRLAATSAQVIGSRQEAVNPVAQQLLQDMVIAQGEELAAAQSLRVLRRAAGRVEADLSSLPEDQVLLLRLQREIDLLERIYLALKEKEQEYEISERATAPASRLVEHAILPDEPARPKRLLSVAAGLAAGLLLGLLAVGMAEHLDDRLHDPDRAATALGVPVLATLGRGRRRVEEPDDRAREALLAVLRQIRAAAPAGGQAGAVLACTQGDDARAVARALADVAAADGDRVLLIAGEGAGLAEAAAARRPVEAPSRVTELAMGETSLQRLHPEALDFVLGAGGADLVLAVATGASGVLRSAPLLRPARPLVLCIDLRRTTATAARRVLRLVGDRGAPVLGLVATGGAGSSPDYCPPREREP